MGNSRDSTPRTPSDRGRTREWLEDKPAQTFTRPPADPRGRTGRTPPPADRWSAAPPPPRHVVSRRPEPSRPTLREIGADIGHELARHWPAVVIAGMVTIGIALIVIGHAIWCYSSLPVDHYLSTERRIRELAPGYHWEGSRYGLTSAWRCPNWQAASFHLVGRGHGDVPAPEAIMCCTAEAKPVCTVLYEP